MTITRDMQIELARFNAGVDRAKRTYYGDQSRPCGCSGHKTCTRHRSIALADLQVATSEIECADLLEVIDRPTPEVDGDPCISGCGRVRDGRHRLCWSCRKDESA